ncbi:MAG: DMT family transporter [Prevotellaceae bacterium]|jgi:drug/metabolite transporter (DMT)-like permease|nr:DMT family transporter [Prevotellaceae bacterium]
MEQSKIKGHAALLTANIIFGLNLPVTRSLIPETFSPYVLTMFRMFGAAALFWLVSLFVRKEEVPLKDKGKLALASLFGIVLNQVPFLVGLSYTSPVDASIVVTLLPVFCMIMAAFVLKEPITWKKAAGVLVGASGVLLLILGQYPASGVKPDNSILGDLIIFISVTSFAVYLTFFKSLISRYSPVTLMKWMFLFASLICIPFYSGDVLLVDYAALSADVYWRVAFIVACSTFFTFMLIPIGQKTLRPTTVSMYNYLQPIVASLVAVALGMSSFGWDKALAAALVFAGVYLVTKSKSRAQMEKEKAEMSGS